MSQNPSRAYESLSDPEEDLEISQDSSHLTETKSLCHWNQQIQSLALKDPNILRANLSNREKIIAIMLCKNLGIQSPYSNLEVEMPIKDWYIHKENRENDWKDVLGTIDRANCELVDVSGVTEAAYLGISKSLNGIQFPFLRELIFEEVPIFSLEFLSLLDAPNLFRLKIEKTNLSSTKSFHKTNFNKIKSISIKNHQIQQYQMLPRMRVCKAPFACHHTKGNLVLMGLYGQNSDFMFQVKVESDNSIANIKQSLKLERYESLKEIAAELEINQQADILKRWNKDYFLIMRNCKRILEKFGELEEIQNREI